MTRYRSQSSPSAKGSHIVMNYPAGTISKIDIIRENASSKQCYDEVVPGFRKRKANGEIFNNPVRITESTFEANDVYDSLDVAKAPPANHQTYHWDQAALASEATQEKFPVVELDVTGATARVALNTIAQVNKTEVDTGNFLGEWSKTKLLHRDILNSVLKLFTEGSKVVVKRPSMSRIPLYDKKGNPLLNKRGLPIYKFKHEAGEASGVGKSKKTQNAANLYLTLRMGLLPLISDLEGACKALASSKARRQTARSSETLQESKTVVMIVPDSYGITHAVNLTTTRTWSVRNGILYESSSAGRMAGQFGLTRPLTSAWNLLPWSFVFDYFLNVGKWLDAIQPSGASRILCAWTSTHETIVYTATVSSSWSKDTGSTICSGSWNGGLIRVNKTYVRSPWMPTVPTSPLEGAGITKSRAYDIAALVLQRIKTRI